jgi:hypothetical protein
MVFSAHLQRISLFALILCIFAAAAILGVLLSPDNSQASWYNTSWNYRQKLVIDSTKVSGSSNHSDFPVLINQKFPQLTTALSSGNDILFTSYDGSTKLMHEIESFDSTTGELVAWVRIPTLDYDDDTTIYLYWGNSAASDQQADCSTAANCTFGSDYIAVYHLNSASSGADDSASSPVDLSENGTPTYQEPGPISYAMGFNPTGQNDDVSASYNSKFDLGTTVTLQAWLKPGDSSEWEQRVINQGNGDDDSNWGMIINDSNKYVQFRTSSSNDWESSISLDEDTWQQLTITFNDNDNDIYIYVDGQEVDSNLNYTHSIATGGNDTFDIGGIAGRNERGFDGLIDEARVLGVVRSADWIATEYTNQSNPQSFFAPSGSVETQGIERPILHWSLNDGTGSTTASDSSSSNLDGTISGATYQPESMCLSSSCLLFDGSDDVVTLTPTVSGVQTVTFWARPTTDTEYFLDLNGSAYIQSSSGVLSATGFTSPTIYINSLPTNTISANRWSNVTITTTSALSASALKLGQISTNYYQGFIDDLKLYDVPLTSSQIQSLYISPDTPRGASASLGGAAIAQNQSLSDGLVGYWKMDENTGTSVYDSSGNNLTGSFSDLPIWGNGKTGSALYFDGINDGIQISDNPVLYPQNGSWTMMVWAKPLDSDQNNLFVGKIQNSSPYEQWAFGICGDFECSTDGQQLVATMVQNGTSYRNVLTTSDISDGNWHHYAIVADSNANNIYTFVDGALVSNSQDFGGSWPTVNNTDPLTFAEYAGGANYSGPLDEVRIYNRALSPSEIQQLYEWAPGPVAHYKFDEDIWGRTLASLNNGLLGHWQMDETSGTNVPDISGNGNNGTTYCSPSWSTGKRRNALEFDASIDCSGEDDEHMRLSNNAFDSYSEGAISVWVKPDDSGDDQQVVFGVGSQQSGNEFITIFYDINDNTLGVYQYDGAAEILSAKTDTLSDPTSWHHIVYQSDSGGHNFYLNGVEQTLNYTIGSSSTHSWFDDPAAGTQYYRFGCATVDGDCDEASIFEGSIDEASYYSRKLSSTEITSLYKSGLGEVVDSSGNDNNGVASGDATATIGKYGNAAKFSGNGSIQIGTSSSSSTPPTFIQEAETDWDYDSTKTTSNFDVQTGDILVAYSIIENGSDDDVSVSGGSLSWTQQEVISEGAFQVWVSIWTATVDSDKTMNVSFESSGALQFGGNVLTFRNSDGVGASAQNDNGYGSGAPSVNITTTQANSAIVVANGDWNAYSGSSRVWRTNAGTLTEQSYYYDTFPNLYTAYGGYHADAGSIGTYAVGLSSPSNQRYGIVAVEVKGESSSGGPSIDDMQTISFWAKPSSTTQNIIDLDEGTHTITMSSGVISANNFSSPTVYIDGVPTTTFPDTDWHHVAITTTTPIDLVQPTFGQISSNYYSGSLDDIRIYNYARTPAQIIQDMNAGHPLVGTPVAGPVGHWKLDEGYGTTAHDTTPNGHDLTLNSASWTNNGKLHKAWDGDGSVWLSLSDDPDFDFASGADFGLSLWARSDSATNPASAEYLISKESSSAGYALYFNTSGQLVCGIDDDSSSFPEDSATTSTDYYDTQWHHALCTRDTTTGELRLYVDGKLQDTDTALSATGDLSNSDSLTLGSRDTTNDTDDFNGDIDEVKIYRAVHAPDDILLEYNQGKAMVLGSTGTDSSGRSDNSAARQYCVPGDSSSCSAPVAHWSFDENVGTSAYDISQNSNTGTLTNSPRWIQGVLGTALLFDSSSSQYVTVADSSSIDSSSAMTIQAWIKPTSNSLDSNYHDIVGKGDSGASTAYNFSLLDNSTLSLWWSSGNQFEDHQTSGTTIILADNWYHIAATRNATLDTVYMYVNGIQYSTANIAGNYSPGGQTNSLSIGRPGEYNGQYFDGAIDDVRIFDYARTPAQIAWDFNRGAPIAWWKFDETSGTTAYDASMNGNRESNGNVGTLYGSPTRVAGVSNNALEFSGSGQYITVEDDALWDLPGDQLSLTAWINMDSDNQYRTIIHREKGTGGAAFALYTSWDSGGRYIFAVNDNWVTCGLNPVDYVGEWIHVTGTYDGSEGNFYHNGMLCDSATFSTSTVNNARKVTIGSESTDGGSTFDSTPWDGKLDDIRIYNYPLTPTQIQGIMNQGAVRF